ncbi:MAG: dienelactone hydrolase family protein, partial [Nitrospiraceae bacterium]
MADLSEAMVQYPSDGVTVRAYMVGPKAKSLPAIIVVQEWWGLNDHIKDVARRYAKEGYVAIVPDLYSRLGNKVTADPNEAGKLMGALQQQDGLKDLNATVNYLKTVSSVDAARIGVTGFCMGGSYALMVPCVNSSIKAAVPFYGQVPNPDTPLQKLACPVLYIYGEDDGW